MVQVSKYAKLFSAMFFCSVVVLFSQCKKDITPDPIPVAKTYLPLSSGSTFSYRSIVNSDTSDYTLTVTSGDSVVKGKSYVKLTSSDGKTRYRDRIDSNYFQIAGYPSLPGSPVYEENYLKANVAVNATWTSFFSLTNPLGFPPEFIAVATYKLVSKGSSLTVNGTIFKDVIHVRLTDVSAYNDSTLAPPAAVTGIATGDFYYALGVGLIQGSLSVPDNPLNGIAEFNSMEKIKTFKVL